MSTYHQQKQRILHLFQAAMAVAREYQQDLVQPLDEARARLVEEKLYVVVCGEYKRGKSSLLNAFLNQPDLFPVDVDVTTSAVSTITFGSHERITVLVGAPGQEQAKTIQRADIPYYVSEQHNPDNTRQVRLLAIETPNPRLEDGLFLVDTPGVGGLNRRHSEVTYAFIPTADAVLFVSDALEPLAQTELDFLQRITRHTQDIIFVITKIDVVEDVEAVVANNREKLAAVLGWPGNKLTIIPVSNTNKLAYLQSGVPEDLADSNFPALEQALWELIHERRGALVLLRALSELGRAVSNLGQPLRIELEAYQQENLEELQAQERRLQEGRDRFQRLLDNNTEWRTQLYDGLQDCREHVLDRFRDGFILIRRNTEEYLDIPQYLSQPERIVEYIESEIDSLMVELSRDLSGQAADVQAHIEAITGLDIDPFNIEALFQGRNQAVFEQVHRSQKTGLWARALTATRRATFEGTTGGTIVALLGAAAGAAIGSLAGGIGAIPGAQIGASLGSAIGGLTGIFTGARQGLKQVREQDKQVLRREVLRVINHYVEDSQRICQKMTSEAIRELERSMRDNFTRRLRDEKESWDRTLRSFQKARKRSQADATRRAAELQRPLQELDRLHKQIEELVKMTVAQYEASRHAPPHQHREQMPAASNTGISTNDEVGSDDSAEWADG